MTRRRLDAELVRRGLAAGPKEARAAIDAGLVLVGGNPANKPTTMVADDTALRLTPPRDHFVSRGGAKLRAGLDRFAIDVGGSRCLDVGASTGGFTDCLLRAGAEQVVAVDVGYGQLAWELRSDHRVTVLERTNVRDVRPEDLPYPPDVVVADLSFTSLRSVVGHLVELGGPAARFVTLVKPQFEADRSDVEAGGVVRDPAAWRSAVERVMAALADAGAPVQGAMASPVRGPAGNVEFLVWAARGGAPLDVDIDGAVVEGWRV